MIIMCGREMLFFVFHKMYTHVNIDYSYMNLVSVWI